MESLSHIVSPHDCSNTSHWLASHLPGLKAKLSEVARGPSPLIVRLLTVRQRPNSTALQSDHLHLPADAPAEAAECRASSGLFRNIKVDRGASACCCWRCSFVGA